jgi:hypothetical protein
MRLDIIKKIDSAKESSWNDVAFLTFDIDWASDEVLSYTLDILEKYDVSATFFVTHATPVLQRIRENPKFELGIHPNFNFLLNGSHQKGKNFQEVIKGVLEIVPEAKSVRSHSLTQNSHLLEAFNKEGLTHDVNHFVSVIANIELRPWPLWNGLIRCPFFWEDDVHFTEKDNYCVDQLLSRKGLKIFNFHPIHVFLNTEEGNRYENTRKFHSNFSELRHFRFKGYGTESILTEILNYIPSSF